jgi:hypothetical protein
MFDVFVRSGKVPAISGDRGSSCSRSISAAAASLHHNLQYAEFIFRQLPGSPIVVDTKVGRSLLYVITIIWQLILSVLLFSLYYQYFVTIGTNIVS